MYKKYSYYKYNFDLKKIIYKLFEICIRKCFIKNLHWYYSNIYLENPKDLKNVEYFERRIFFYYIYSSERESRNTRYFLFFFFNEYITEILYKIYCININIINF